MLYTDGDPPLFQAFYRVELARGRRAWHSISGAVPAAEYAVRHALLDAEKHVIHNAWAELVTEYRGESGYPGYPCHGVEYGIVRLNRSPFWCCMRLSEMGTVVERFRVDLTKHRPEHPAYELATATREDD